MKSIKSYLLITGLFLVLSGCTRENLFDDPLNAISTSAAFSSADRIEKAAIGMYSALQNPNWGCGRNFIYTDVQGLDANPNTFFGNIGYFSQMRADDGTVSSAWTAAYQTIYTANLFYKNLQPAVDLVGQEKADQYIGESRFIRAYNYFYLVNLWGQPYNDPINGPETNLGVPLVLEAADDAFSSANFIPRATVKAVYDQIEADLMEALSLLPENYADRNATVSRATKDAARALLMRLYLYKSDYTQALDYANQLINSGKFQLDNSPEVTFRDYLTSERIFSIAFSGSNNPDRNNALSAHYSPLIRGDISVSQAFISLMDTTRDLRYKNLVIKTASNGNFYSTKYTSFIDWVPVLRYAEVLLVKAEALARQADPNGVANNEALTLINQIRQRAQAVPLVPTNNAALIEAIMKERRIELAFEGQSYFDFQRTLQDIPAHSVIQNPVPYGDNYRVFPIPLRDLRIMTDGLAQNAGY